MMFCKPSYIKCLATFMQYKKETLHFLNAKLCSKYRHIYYSENEMRKMRYGRIRLMRK